MGAFLGVSQNQAPWILLTFNKIPGIPVVFAAHIFETDRYDSGGFFHYFLEHFWNPKADVA